MKRKHVTRFGLTLFVGLLLFSISACNLPIGGDMIRDAAATTIQQTVQATPKSGGDGSEGGLQPISPAHLTATSVAAEAADQPPSTNDGDDQASPEDASAGEQSGATPTTQSMAQMPASQTPETASDGQQPAAPTATLLPSPTSQPPPTRASQPSSTTSSYVELYTNEGVDLDNSGGPDEMAYFEYKESDPNPGHGIGQRGARCTVWVDMGTTAPTYETCTALTRWHTSLNISHGHYYCYITDQLNYGYLRVDRLEQVGTGGSELSPWVLGISFTTWLP